MTTPTTPQSAIPPLTPDRVLAWIHDPTAAVLRGTLMVAIAAALTTRAKADAYVRPIFDRFTFTNDRTHRGVGSGERITKPADVYLSTDDAQVAAFFAACDEAHAAQGFELEPGVCPACVAEAQVVAAETALLKHAVAAGILPAAILWSRMEYRDRALSLLLSGVKP